MKYIFYATCAFGILCMLDAIFLILSQCRKWRICFFLSSLLIFLAGIVFIGLGAASIYYGKTLINDINKFDCKFKSSKN